MVWENCSSTRVRSILRATEIMYRYDRSQNSKQHTSLHYMYMLPLLCASSPQTNRQPIEVLSRDECAARSLIVTILTPLQNESNLAQMARRTLFNSPRPLTQMVDGTQSRAATTPRLTRLASILLCASCCV